MKKIILLFGIVLCNVVSYAQSVSLELTSSMEPSVQHLTLRANGETTTNYVSSFQYDWQSEEALNPGLEYTIGLGDYDDFSMNSLNYFITNGLPTQKAFMVWTNSPTPITVNMRFVCYDGAYREITSEVFEVTIFPDPLNTLSLNYL